MTTGRIDLTELPPTPAAVVRGHVGAPQIPEFLSAACTDVMRLLGAQHRAPAGPPFARCTRTADGFDVEAGFPSSAPIDPAGPVVSSVLPGRPAAITVYRGPYESLGETFDAVAGWLTAHGPLSSRTTPPRRRPSRRHRHPR